MKSILFFDTETTGLPKNWKAKMTDLDNWPRIIQLAAYKFDERGNEIESFELLIKPDGWTVPNGRFWIDNGFSQSDSLARGVSIKQALERFISYHDESMCMVAHNMDYDYNVLGAEMIRARLSCKTRIQRFCTKEIGTNFCAIPGLYGFKWPQLEELYFELFGEQFTDAHQAGSDVKATAKCFFELAKRGVIDLGSLAIDVRQ